MIFLGCQGCLEFPIDVAVTGVKGREIAREDHNEGAENSG